MLKQNPDRPLHIFLWSVVGAVLAWSFVGCHDRFTWFMEVFPVIVGTIFLLYHYVAFRFTRLVCWILAIHAIILIIGGHYTYAEVPWFNWLRDHFHMARNYYDRVGHFFQGLTPALVSREILIRRGVVKRGGWLNFITICICMAISATYELLEWQTAVWTGAKAESFLGTQGDPWDTQWDMATAGIGAIFALVFLAPVHDRQMNSLE